MAASRGSCGGLAIACRSSLAAASRRHIITRVPASQLAGARSLSTTSSRLTTLASFKTPKVFNEPNQHYAKGSPQRKGLYSALEAMKQRGPVDIPIVVGGKEMHTEKKGRQHNPADHASTVATYSLASESDVQNAIDAALAAKPGWEAMPFADRAAIFLKAADLISNKYRYEIMAATMLGQGKNAWQAEIDAAAELCDFFRFNVAYAEELYAQQPSFHSAGVWNRAEYRPLEGFVYAVSPFNFTAIGGNLAGAPALLGNVVVWKPSDSAVLSNWIVYKILREAGLPEGVIQFVPGDAVEVTRAALQHRQFAALHYTGSTAVFRKLYGEIGAGVAGGRYAGYPRVVGETGGKNFHLVHRSADLDNAAVQTVRGAFEFQGQKCSATSRLYAPRSVWPQLKEKLIAETRALKVGPPTDPANFVGPVIHAASFEKLRRVIDEASKDPEVGLLTGGKYDDSKGFYVHPTIFETRNPAHQILNTEFFGPILGVHVYDDMAGGDPEKAFADVCKVVDGTSEYGLTGAVFAADRAAVRFAEDALRNAAGNFYVNCKSTGAVVGQQPFGGARASGTNDKAGSVNLLGRFVSVRSIKEEFGAAERVAYNRTCLCWTFFRSADPSSFRARTALANAPREVGVDAFVAEPSASTAYYADASSGFELSEPPFLVIIDKDGRFSYLSIVLFGDQAVYHRGGKFDKTLEAGEFALTDIGSTLHGYGSDVTQAILPDGASASEELMDIWGTVHAAQEAGFGYMHANETFANVDAPARVPIEDAGYGAFYTHRLGHGLGLGMHEHPYLNGANKEKLKLGGCHK
ncbi:hypothetical protein DL765_006964 [Monosporascus sp. GIB2]|nr:hypothetical protein DL765_006964 [Monosporascus sp. GIB2]